MASNSFGQIFRMTTWGESHGKAIGVVIDGCPSGLELSEEEINAELAKRAPGASPYTSPRQEGDCVEILSGLFEGKTTGTPISMVIPNNDADSSKYEGIRDVLRPGHANFTYLEKYGVFDYRGGGRASARETAGRVAAGAVAKKILASHEIEVLAFLRQVGDVLAEVDVEDVTRSQIEKSPVFCPDPKAMDRMTRKIEDVKQEGDSIGGVVEVIVKNLPVGLGDPVYEKCEAVLAHALMGIPASKGVEIGAGFRCAMMKGSEHNDSFENVDGEVRSGSNHAGGVLGGITTGMPLVARVAFKPTSSIRKPQKSIDLGGEELEFQLPEGSRHDPCVAVRAVPVVEAMTALVMVDRLLMFQAGQLQGYTVKKNFS